MLCLGRRLFREGLEGEFWSLEGEFWSRNFLPLVVYEGSFCWFWKGHFWVLVGLKMELFWLWKWASFVGGFRKGTSLVGFGREFFGWWVWEGDCFGGFGKETFWWVLKGSFFCWWV